MLFLLLVLSGLGQLTSAGYCKLGTLQGLQGQSIVLLDPEPGQPGDHPGCCHSPPSFRVLWHPRVGRLRAGLGQLSLTYLMWHWQERPALGVVGTERARMGSRFSTSSPRWRRGQRVPSVLSHGEEPLPGITESVCVCVCVYVLGMFTHVFLPADSEMSHVQVIVPQKLGTNTNEGDAPETHAIMKSLKKKTCVLFLLDYITQVNS